MYPEGVRFFFIFFLLFSCHCVGKVYTFEGSWRQNASLFNLKALAFGNSFSFISAMKDLSLTRKKIYIYRKTFEFHSALLRYEWHYWLGGMVKAELPMCELYVTIQVYA